MQPGSYGFCYTRIGSKGKYKVCPGYKSTSNNDIHPTPVSKKKNKSMKLPNKNMEKLVNQLKIQGFKKHATTVAKKMLRYGKGMNDYSKTTGKLKKGH
jgi:hypothetical protein